MKCWRTTDDGRKVMAIVHIRWAKKGRGLREKGEVMGRGGWREMGGLEDGNGVRTILHLESVVNYNWC